MKGLEGSGKTGSRSWVPPAGPGSPPAWLEKQLVEGWRARRVGRRRERGAEAPGANLWERHQSEHFLFACCTQLLSFDLLTASVHPHFLGIHFQSSSSGAQKKKLGANYVAHRAICSCCPGLDSDPERIQAVHGGWESEVWEARLLTAEHLRAKSC